MMYIGRLGEFKVLCLILDNQNWRKRARKISNKFSKAIAIIIKQIKICITSRCKRVIIEHLNIITYNLLYHDFAKFWISLKYNILVVLQNLLEVSHFGGNFIRRNAR